MESGHAEAASSMAATAAASGDDLLGRRFALNLSSGISVKEHSELVESVAPHYGSVGRIILADESKKGVVQTGTAFLVYKGDERCLFLTCSHNFEKQFRGEEEIRLLPTAAGDTVKDYPIEHIVYRHVGRDLLLFSVKDLLPGRQCLELSTEEVKEYDKVVILGFSGGRLPVKNKEEPVHPAAVLAPSILTGVVNPGGPEINKDESDKYHEEIYYGCKAIQGHSGAPVFNTNNKVVAVHIASDRTCRDGVSTNTVIQSLREHLGTDNNEDTIEKLLEAVYEKSAHVPYAKKLEPVKKKSKGKARS